MSHTTCTQGNWINSWLLVVGSQIVNLIHGPSFAHNLCFRCPNGSYEPILDIYVPRSFQWYEELINSLSFDPCNFPLKIWESRWTPISQSGSCLGSVKVHSLTLSYIPGSMWCDALTGCSQPCKPLCLGREPKSKVVTIIMSNTFSPLPKS
jgi:hypothetical protein